jgi:hypothetical protein
MIAKHIKVEKMQRRLCKVSLNNKWFLRLGGLMLLLASSAVSAAASVLWGS